MIGYWYRLLHGRFKLWQLLLLGMMWIGGGVALTVILSDLGGIGVGPGLLFYGSGALHFWFAYKAIKEQRALDAMQETVALRDARPQSQIPPRPKLPANPTEPQLPSPPRIGDDPFRNPPFQPIVVERPKPRSVATPIIAGNPDEKPKILV